jgi:hypothetical protein
VGDAKSGPSRLLFNPQVCVEFHGATVTSDAGLLLPRELDEHLGLNAPATASARISSPHFLALRADQESKRSLS